MKRRSTIVNGFLVVAVFAAGGFGYLLLAGDSGAVATARTETVERGTVLSTVSATGTVVSPDDVGASFVSSGTLTRVAVEVGDEVAAGEVLAAIDKTEARQAVAAAKSGLASAKSNLAEAQGDQTSAERSSASANAVQSQQQVATAQTKVAQAKQTARLNNSSYDLAVDQAQSAYDIAKSRQSSSCGGGSTAACDLAKADTRAAKNAYEGERAGSAGNHLRPRLPRQRAGVL
jgi:multidrug efflux pump subunit AcrA (membrane-fusion protein)